MAKEAAPVVLRLDHSKKYSTVHGERGPTDPHADVAYIQDGLPYDGEGVLVKDDGRVDPWDTVIEGKAVRCWPLYTKDMREKVQRKLARIQNGLPKDDVTEHDDESLQEDASEDVNLESWLRGEAKYAPFMIFAACKRRYSKNYSKFRDVIEDLVLDQKIVPEDQVAPELLRHITQPTS